MTVVYIDVIYTKISTVVISFVIYEGHIFLISANIRFIMINDIKRFLEISKVGGYIVIFTLLRYNAINTVVRLMTFLPLLHSI